MTNHTISSLDAITITHEMQVDAAKSGEFWCGALVSQGACYAEVGTEGFHRTRESLIKALVLQARSRGANITIPHVGRALSMMA